MKIESNFFNLKPPDSTVWKIFFLIFLFIKVITIFDMFNDTNIQIHNCMLELLTFFYFSIGLYGYCWGKPILKKAIWKQAIPVLILYEVYVLVDINVNGSLSGGILNPYFVFYYLVFFITLTIPTVYALYQYAFNSPQYWKDT